jgi:hypothetical protein
MENMNMMKDSQIDQNWIKEQMRVNPPSLRPNGNIFSGPVRLSFVNLFKPGKPNQAGAEGKYGAALLFPPGTNMDLFAKVWTEEAKKAFPQNWDAAGNPVGLHSPFHDQAEKAYGAKPLAGYTPGGITFNVSSKFKPVVVDANQNLIVDESRVYAGCWCFVALNTYSYGISPPQPKRGISFGLQTVMLIADDSKLAGGGGNPAQDFGEVKLTAQSNIAAKFDQLPGATPTAAPSIMPATGHTGTAGSLPVHPLPASGDDISKLM